MGWAGVAWQNPANNWGEFDGGYNLTKAKKLSFWARGDKGGEIVEFKLGGTAANYPDSENLTTGALTLKNEWTAVHSRSRAGRIFLHQRRVSALC